MRLIPTSEHDQTDELGDVGSRGAPDVANPLFDLDSVDPGTWLFTPQRGQTMVHQDVAGASTSTQDSVALAEVLTARTAALPSENVPTYYDGDVLSGGAHAAGDKLGLSGSSAVAMSISLVDGPG